MRSINHSQIALTKRTTTFASSAMLGLLIGATLMNSPASATSRNQVAGTWRMVSAEIERDGKRTPAYGERPAGLLIFASDMHYVEVLTDGDMPRFASDTRGEGTDAENRRAMATSIGMFGTYTVDAQGRFTGDKVEGATFPNWIGDVRTRKDLTIEVVGNQMVEHFTRPDGTRIVIVLERVDG